MKKEKLYAIYKNSQHIGNIKAMKPKLAVLFYCMASNVKADYLKYKAIIAKGGKHYENIS